MPKHIRWRSKEGGNLPKRQQGATKIPDMDGWVFAVIRRGELGALVDAFAVMVF